jgi:hypothetical protein|nr:MAG TPA: restriction enzyme [Caudoviricetes sp.]
MGVKGRKILPKLTLELLKEERPDIEILGEYINNYTKLKVRCSCGNIYEAAPSTLRKGHKCMKCSGNNKITLDIVQKERPDLFIVEVVNAYNIYYLCPTCGTKCKTSYSWLTNKDVSKRTKGCIKCHTSRLAKSKFSTKEELQKKCPDIEILGEYVDSYTPIEYRCRCGEIHKSKPQHLTQGKRCGHCKRYTGEEVIKDFLNSNSISYIKQYRFKDCRDKLPLPFDFYLPDYNMCIEYDGLQHFEQRKGWTDLSEVQLHDSIKTNYCKSNNITLLRISYRQLSEIQDILTETFKS